MNKNNLVTVQDLQELKAEIISEIKLIIGNSTTKKDWLRSSEVMEMLSISSGTLQNLRINRDIPFTKMGGTLYYETSEVVKALNRCKAA
ncbi:MAG: helix-turn-helix domain-containing protein [Flavobacteriales bacterium]|nr:helix-turn-helix domain-containing protein [Flavobacteriales bacterium]